MSYATTDHVASEFPDIEFTVTSKVTIDDVTRFLSEADVEIDSLICSRYLTPITGTNALIMVRMIEIWLVKHRIMAITMVKSPEPKASQGNDTDLRVRALAMLDSISLDKIRLQDAPRASTSGGMKSYAVDHNVPHIFKRGERQW